MVGKIIPQAEIQKSGICELVMKVSKYLEIFRALSYPGLFSGECLNALKFIQDNYGKAESHHVIYEVNLNDPARTLDFSYKFYEGSSPCPYWYEFDYGFYSKGNLSHGYFIDQAGSAPLPGENEEAVIRVTGREKFEILGQPLKNLEKFLADRGSRVMYLGNLDHRGYSESVRIETRVRTFRKLIEFIQGLSYSGDISLVEETMSKIEPYAGGRAYLLSFDLFADRISDRIGAAFFPFTSLNDIQDLVNFLTENKFCLYEKGQDLLKWSGDPLPEGMLQQRINFIKIQFEKNNIVSVKAYLMQSDEIPLDFLLYAGR